MTQNKSIRQRAIDWLNSKHRDPSEGLEILIESNLKPHVYDNFKKNMSRQDIPRKIVNEMRILIQSVSSATFKPAEKPDPEIVGPIEMQKAAMSSPHVATDFYPPQISVLITEFRDLYTQRSIMHNQLKQVGEGNSDEEVQKRQELVNAIAVTSERMDAIWPVIDNFNKTGKVEEVEEPKEPVVQEPKKEVKQIELATTVEELKKQSDNWRVKIMKAKNRLNYQSENKEKKPNPMPDGPKRVILLKRIEKLTAEKLIIDNRRAELM